MSADNGIYILATSRKGKTVYRVARACAIDNVDYYEENEVDHFPEYLKSIWDDSARYTDHLEALNRANYLNRYLEYTEYGVADIDKTNWTFPGD